MGIFQQSTNRQNPQECNRHTFTDDDFASFLNRSPKIKISKMYVSQNFPLREDQYDELVRSFSDLVYDKLGYFLGLKRINTSLKGYPKVNWMLDSERSEKG
jgi:hypothetical protein